MSGATASIVITACNEGELLGETLDAIGASTPGDTEVIVVDDWSTDGSTASVNGGVRVLRPPRRLGITGARNFGAAAASGDVIVFSDAHVNPMPGWLEPLCTALEDPNVGEVAPVVSALGREWDKGYGFTWRDPSLTMSWLREQWNRTPYSVPFLCGCFIALRRDVFQESGGFDEGLRGWGSEDAELSVRLWLLGYECRVVPDSEIAHLFRPQFPYRVKWKFTLHNTLRLAALHLPPAALARVVAHHAQFPAFGDAYARLMTSNAQAQRDYIHSIRRFDGDWFIDRFDLDALR